MNQIITLPWPPSILSPNKIAHWAQKAKVKAKVKSDCFYIVKSLGLKIDHKDNIPLTIYFYPPTRRKYDIDNLLASCKSSLDGVAEALGVNDRRFRPITIDFRDVVENGKIEIII